MAYTTINKSTSYFDTKTWSGNNTDPTTISGLNFQPDMVWAKARSGTYSTQDHCLNDAVRGANKILRVNQSNAEETDDNNLKSFTSDGWTMGNDGKINQASTEYVGWSWKANGTGSANTDGTISSTVSANTTAGFSIVKYTGNGTAGATVGHGLGATMDFAILRRYTQTSSWLVYHKSLGATKAIYLNETGAVGTNSSGFNDTAPTSSVFTLGNGATGNTSSADHIAYCFSEKAGYSKFGSYTGNGSTDGTFIYTGFKPVWIMFRETGNTNSWRMTDSVRDTYNPKEKSLNANSNSAEANSGYTHDALSNGFKIRTTDTNLNRSGGNYIYMAFGQSLVGSNNVPCTAR